jgi:hypothetical protein
LEDCGKELAESHSSALGDAEMTWPSLNAM